MFKTLQNIDELEHQHHGKGSLSKIDKMTKKEVLEKEKPINPKFIFEGKIKKKISDKKFRKPKPTEDTKPQIINLYDF
jgi:hypothetical protein